MTPGARAAAAIELADAIEADPRQPADRLVGAWFRRRRYAGSGDRAAIARLVYTLLRRRAQLDWWVECAGQRPDTRRRVVAALMLGEGWTTAQLDAAFDGGRYRPAPLDEAELALAAQCAGRPLDAPSQPLHVRGNIPEWLVEPLRVTLGERLEDELAALLLEAPVDLRVNLLKSSVGEAMALLAADGIEARPTPLSPIGLRLGSRVSLGGARAFRNGAVELQDDASQVACLMVGAQPGEAVVDFCAGAGGKTLALAAAMRNQGRLVACDISASRLARSRPRLARAGATIVEERLLDGAAGLWSGAEEGGFDRVLVDAPCSGTGTWRRAPEMRWRLGESELAGHVARQAAILESAVRLVAPGGRLVYAVCSLLGPEGEGQVLDFLRKRPDFEALPAKRDWARAIEAGYPCGDVHLRLLPGRDGSDGFFVSVMQRSKKK